MYAKVLIPLDGSKSAEAAVDEAVGLAPAVHSAHLALVELRFQRLQFDEYAVYRDAIRKIREAQGMEYLLPFRRRLEAAGIRVDTAILSGDPVTAIADFTRKESFELVLLGAKGGWLARRFGPSHYANRLARSVDAEVMTVRGGGRKTIRRPVVQPEQEDSSELVPRRA